MNSDNAWVFVGDKNILPCAQVAVFTCREHHPHTDILFYAMDTDTASDPILNRYANVIYVEPDARLKENWVSRTCYPPVVANKVIVFKNSHSYKRLCYVDADTVFLRNGDEIFEATDPQWFHALPVRKGKRKFAAGPFWIFSGDMCGEDVYEGMIDLYRKRNSFWEEGMISEWFDGRIWFLSRDLERLRGVWGREGNNPLFIHYAGGEKPWQNPNQPDAEVWLEAQRRMQAANPTIPRKNDRAVAFICDKNYIEGLKVAAWSVREFSPNLDIIVYTKDAELRDDPVLEKLVTHFEEIRSDEALVPFRAWRCDFPQIVAEKLTVFRKSFGYKQICLMDADMIAMQDFTGLFEAAPDFICGLSARIKGGRTVVHGGLVIIPEKFLNEEAYQRIIEQCKKNGTTWEEWAIATAFEGEIYFFSDRTIYSPRSRLRPHYDNPFFIHYVGAKPWNEYRNDAGAWYQAQQRLHQAFPEVYPMQQPENRKIKVISYLRQQRDWQPVAVSCRLMRKNGGLPGETQYILYTSDPEVLQDTRLHAFFDEIKMTPAEAYEIIPPAPASDEAFNEMLKLHCQRQLDQEAREGYRQACYVKSWLFVNEPLADDDDICIYLDWDCFPLAQVAESFPDWREGQTWSGSVFKIFSARRRVMCYCPVAGYLVKNGKFNQHTAPRIMEIFRDWNYVDDFQCKTVLDEKVFTIYTFETKNRDLKGMGGEWNISVDDFTAGKHGDRQKIFHWMGIEKPFVRRSEKYPNANAWYDEQVKDMMTELEQKQPLTETPPAKPFGKVKVIWYQDSGNWEPVAVSCNLMRKNGGLPKDTLYILYTSDENILNDTRLSAFFDEVKRVPDNEEIPYQYGDLLSRWDVQWPEEKHTHYLRCCLRKLLVFVNEPLENKEDIW